MTKYEFIEKNKKVIDSGYRVGITTSSCLFQYQLTKDFKALDKRLGKMVRYQWVADENRVSMSTVRDAIKSMKEKV